MIRGADIWLAPFLRQALTPRKGPGPGRPLIIYLTVADHFEPFWNQADDKTALERLAVWEERLPRLCRDIVDERGRPPQHCFFYPLEDYRPEILDRLAALCRQGLGEVEVHLHHHGESSAQLEDILSSYAQLLHDRHGCLHRDPETGRPLYGFIHGNWSLDNSRPDGKWCGVNDELLVLAKTGCYADFTLPSAPSRTQTRMVNSIYYATDDPDRPKSHDLGRPARVGAPPDGDLLMIQGVLALDWGRQKYGILPRLETSDLGAHYPPSRRRIPMWIRYAPAVAGADHVRFIKLCCHGAPERHYDALLGRSMKELFMSLAGEYNDRYSYRLRFVTCWEMVQAIHALERGEELD